MSGVQVRKMVPGDAPHIARIWMDGLSQTAEGMEDESVADKVRQLMKEYGEKACSAEGDMGPQGSYMFEKWGNKDNSIMYVAEFDGRVVGSIAVQLGMEFGEPSEEESFASLWRMSVCDSIRRKGVGKQLMSAAESWARSQNCSLMKLYTANLIAASFYEMLGYVVVATDCSKGPVEIRTYSKEL